jgi:hypothetical protein
MRTRQNKNYGDPSREPTPSVADLGPEGADLSQTRSLADLGQTRIALTGNAILQWPNIKRI